MCKCIDSLVSAASAGVRGVFAAVECGITQTAIVGFHVNLSSHTACLAIFCACLHRFPHLHVLLHR